MSRSKTLSTRVPETFVNLINEYIKRDSHLNFSDLIRDALREKIKRDTPELYNSMFNEEVAA
jgi:Arc/MetJ-type ribon-helix-helix transcriptional regulator